MSAPLRPCLTLACLALLLTLLPVTARAGVRRAGNYRVVNLMPDFWHFWDKAEGKPTHEKIQLFRQLVQEPNARVFEDAVPAIHRDDSLATYLESLPRFVPAMRTLSDRLTAELPRYQASFQAAFPDMNWDGDVYFLPSGFGFDGAVRSVSGKPALLFGVDMIAALQGKEGNIAPLFHHELFHLYHRAISPGAFTGNLRSRCWTEGLAVYVSHRLNPTATSGELLGSPDLQRRTSAELPRLIREVRGKMSSWDATDLRNFFDGSSKRSDVPARAGYAIGLLIVRDVSTRLPLPALTRLSEHELEREFRVALRHYDGLPLSPEECREDVAAAFALLERIRPAAVNARTQERMKEKAKLEKSFTRSLSRGELYARLAPVVARFGGGAVTLRYPAQEWATHQAGGGLRFPFEVRIDGEKLYGTQSLLDNPFLPIGAEIRAINGIMTKIIVSRLRSLTGANGVPAREREAELYFAPNLYFLFGWGGPFNVEYVPTDGGKPRSRVMDGAPIPAVGVSSEEPSAKMTDILLPNSGLSLNVAGEHPTFAEPSNQNPSLSRVKNRQERGKIRTDPAHPASQCP